MVKTPEELKALARVMREEGIGYFKQAPDGTVEVYLAPGVSIGPSLAKPKLDEDEAEATDDPAKKPSRHEYDELFPRGRPRLPSHDPDAAP